MKKIFLGLFYLLLLLPAYASAGPFDVIFHFSTTSQATSTTLSVTTASSSAFTISGIGNGSTQCLQINGIGTISGTGGVCGAGGGSSFGKTLEFPAGITDAISPTTTVGIIVNASSSITAFSAVNATTTNATSTQIVVSSNGAVGRPSVCIGTSCVGVYQANTATLGLSNGTAGLSWNGVGFYPNTTDVRTLGIAGNVWNGLLVTNSTTTNATTTIFYTSGGALLGGASSTIVNLNATNITCTGCITDADISSTFLKTVSVNSPLGGNGTAGSPLTCTTCVTTSRAINTTYPVKGGGDLSADRTISLDFGTTTTNTWSQLQTFTSGILANASSTLQNFTFVNATGTQATTTTLSVTTASSSALTISGLGSGSTQCLQINGQGAVAGSGGACGGSGSPGNPTESLQYNSGGSFAGVGLLRFNMPNARLGIGTTSPGALFSIAATSTSATDQSILYGLNSFIYASSSTTTIPNGSINAFVWATSSASSVTQPLISLDTSNNRIGMGTTAPGTLLSLGNSNSNYANIDTAATSTFSRGINVTTGCFSINSACGGAATTTITIPVDCNMPRATTTPFLTATVWPGGADWEPLVMSNNNLGLGAWQMADATSSDVFCQAVMPPRLDAIPHAFLHTVMLATTTAANAILDIYGISIDPTSGSYDPAETSMVTLLSASTTAASRFKTSGTAWSAAATNTPLTGLTLNPSNVVALRYRRFGNDANDAVNNAIFIPTMWIEAEVDLNK